MSVWVAGRAVGGSSADKNSPTKPCRAAQGDRSLSHFTTARFVDRRGRLGFLPARQRKSYVPSRKAGKRDAGGGKRDAGGPGGGQNTPDRSGSVAGLWQRALDDKGAGGSAPSPFVDSLMGTVLRECRSPQLTHSSSSPADLGRAAQPRESTVPSRVSGPRVVRSANKVGRAQSSALPFLAVAGSTPPRCPATPPSPPPSLPAQWASESTTRTSVVVRHSGRPPTAPAASSHYRQTAPAANSSRQRVRGRSSRAAAVDTGTHSTMQPSHSLSSFSVSSSSRFHRPLQLMQYLRRHKAQSVQKGQRASATGDAAKDRTPAPEPTKDTVPNVDEPVDDDIGDVGASQRGLERLHEQERLRRVQRSLELQQRVRPRVVRHSMDVAQVMALAGMNMDLVAEPTPAAVTQSVAEEEEEKQEQEQEEEEEEERKPDHISTVQQVVVEASSRPTSAGDLGRSLDAVLRLGQHPASEHPSGSESGDDIAVCSPEVEPAAAKENQPARLLATSASAPLLPPNSVRKLHNTTSVEHPLLHRRRKSTSRSRRRTPHRRKSATTVRPRTSAGIPSRRHRMNSTVNHTGRPSTAASSKSGSRRTLRRKSKPRVRRKSTGGGSAAFAAPHVRRQARPRTATVIPHSTVRSNVGWSAPPVRAPVRHNRATQLRNKLRPPKNGYVRIVRASAAFSSGVPRIIEFKRPRNAQAYRLRQILDSYMKAHRPKVSAMAPAKVETSSEPVQPATQDEELDSNEQPSPAPAVSDTADDNKGWDPFPIYGQTAADRAVLHAFLAFARKREWYEYPLHWVEFLVHQDYFVAAFGPPSSGLAKGNAAANKGKGSQSVQDLDWAQQTTREHKTLRNSEDRTFFAWQLLSRFVLPDLPQSLELPYEQRQQLVDEFSRSTTTNNMRQSLARKGNSTSLRVRKTLFDPAVATVHACLARHLCEDTFVVRYKEYLAMLRQSGGKGGAHCGT